VIGTARTTAAITIVNGLPTGFGCALGVALPVRARVVLEPAPAGQEPSLRFSRGAATPVVRETLRLAIDRYAAGGPWNADLHLRSEIPPARGLKSSSAVATAVALATARAAGREPPDLEIARLAAGAARTSGISATGAFDDAIAGLRSGFCLANNRTDELVRHGPVDPRWRVSLLVPGGRHLPSPEWKRAFERRAADSTRAVDAALEGRWWEAMAINSELVEEVVGYAYATLRADLASRGALGSGVSGLGPAFAAISEPPHEAEVLGAMPKERGTVRALSVATEADREDRS